MPANNPLNKKHLQALNQHLADLQIIQEELKPAVAAGVPNSDQHAERCTNCIEAIKRVKKAYFPRGT